MKFKEYYRDENDFIDDYCKSVDCDACKGTGMNGEPNGYGCEDMENFTGENYEKYMKEEDEIIDLLEQKLAKAEAALKVYEEAVGFYADTKNWICSHAEYYEQYAQISLDSETFGRETIGGKRARQAQQKVKEILGVKG